MFTVGALMKPEYMRRPETEQAQVLTASLRGAYAAGYELDKIPHANRLIAWGYGDPDVQNAVRRVRGNGGHTVLWDLGYFRRDDSLAKRGFRLSIDVMHPDKFIMAREWPRDRWDALGIKLRNDYDPNGPIILIGMGYKSAAMYGEAAGQWERDTAVKIHSRWPCRRLIFRPKAGNALHCKSVPGAVIDDRTPISEALKGASLVICRHSNAAIDAIIAGIPCVTTDGAARAVVPNILGCLDVRLPEPLRLKFLRNLAYFEWTLAEMRTGRVWEVIEVMIEDIEAA